MNNNDRSQTIEVLHSLSSNSFAPLILQPSTIHIHFNTHIDEIFLNAIDPDIISGDLVATILNFCLNLQ